MMVHYCWVNYLTFPLIFRLYHHSD